MANKTNKPAETKKSKAEKPAVTGYDNPETARAELGVFISTKSAEGKPYGVLERLKVTKPAVLEAAKIFAVICGWDEGIAGDMKKAESKIMVPVRDKAGKPTGEFEREADGRYKSGRKYPTYPNANETCFFMLNS
jgi:hypothetical protein